MRVAIAALYLGLAATVQSVSAEVKKANRDWFAATPDAQPTYFDGKQVPALPVLTDEAEFNQTKYLVVKYASPYSPHCVQFKPTYQTIYEYYYTSDIPVNHDVALPAPAATTFEEYYGLKFSTVDCINTDKICRQQGIIAYPTTILYKNGELVASVRGAKNMTTVADLIENALESEYPGTRPLHPLLPAAGASSRPVPENVPQGEVPTDESQKPLNAGERSV
ncbi:hypothetical protein PFICI_03114 [Pestalotiopsis fici W106-1]|uniref:Thioredoxin domain-containing protein n=1 Tax=Pestalotiopsis fici (strain W106-1 / CGMCC3.15140) TaxID=1229662 RepID=W3XGF3_PESFW|nr:uncharacterized protein PFICI_03114 [Pestalotiopsis fici W106-1]ETS85089.1 hypothetical protein PFICI_03114 [Pestalotiopsis fici W106-1]